MGIKFENFATSTIANVGGIAAGDLSLDVQPGDGALFPTLAAGEYFYIVCVDASGNREIMKVTARAVDTFTITRAQDGTSAIAFAEDDKVELRVTAATLEEFATLTDTQTLTNKTLTAPTLTSPVLNTAVSGTAVLDEDNMASDSATKLATQQSIKAYVDTKVAVVDGKISTHCDNANGNPNLSDTYLDIEAAIVENAWETVGPTGSGADNIWTALDGIPAGVDWVRLRIYATGNTTTGTSTQFNDLTIFAREANGTDPSVLNSFVGSRVLSLGGYIDSGGNSYASDVAEVTIPVDANGCFEINWASTYQGQLILAWAVGYGYNQ